MEENKDNIIALTNDLGEQEYFELIDQETYEGNEYIILLPTDDEDGEVVILQLEGDFDPETENYIGVEDMDVLEHVFAQFKEKFKDELEFEE